MHVHNHTILLLNWQIGNTRSNPKSASLGQFTWRCCSSGTMPHTHSNTLIVVETTPHQRFVLYNYTFYTESGSILTFCFTFTEHPPRAVVLFLPSPTITNVAQLTRRWNKIQLAVQHPLLFSERNKCSMILMILLPNFSFEHLFLSKNNTAKPITWSIVGHAFGT